MLVALTKFGCVSTQGQWQSGVCLWWRFSWSAGGFIRVIGVYSDVFHCPPAFQDLVTMLPALANSVLQVPHTKIGGMCMSVFGGSLGLCVDCTASLVCILMGVAAHPPCRQQKDPVSYGQP